MKYRIMFTEQRNSETIVVANGRQEAVEKFWQQQGQRNDGLEVTDMKIREMK